MHFWRKIPLKGRIILLIILGMVLILGIFSYLGLSAINESTQRVLAERLALTRQMAANLNLFLEHVTTHITESLNTEDIDLEDSNPIPEQLFLRQIYETASLPVHYASLLDREGNIVMIEPPLAFREVANRQVFPHVNNALLNLKPHWSNVYYDMLEQREVVYAAMPILSQGQTLVALVEVAVDLSQPDLQRFIQTGNLGTTGYVEIVDGTGVVLATSKPQSFLRVNDHGNILASLIKEQRTAVSTCHRCHENTGRMPEEKDIITFAPIATNVPWGVVLRQQETEALAPTSTLQKQWAILGAAALLATVFLGWITTESVVRPVRSLTTASQRIASGDLSVTINSTGEDEIGLLAHNFDTMRARLREYLETMKQRATELESLNAIAGIMNHSLELDIILESVLGKVMNLVNGEMGGILILDESTQTLSYRVHRGFTEKFVQGVSDLKVGEGIAGRVAQTGEPILVDDISRDPRLTRPVVSEEGLRAFLSIPIRSRDRVIGVLNITSREPRQFSSHDIKLLAAIGDQVGVSIERARLYDELRHKEKIRGDLLSQIITAQEEERKRIARDLHDETSQALTALTMNLESIARKPASEPEELKTSLKKTQDMAIRTLQDVHRIIFDLRPTLLDDLGLIAALRWYAKDRLESQEVEVHIDTLGTEKRLPGEIEAALFRIAQEAISNIAQHARARRADLNLEFRTDSIVFTVEDDGAGFDTGKVFSSGDGKRGLGLMGMKERTELFGGIIDIESKPGAGTMLSFVIPINWESLNDDKDKSPDS